MRVMGILNVTPDSFSDGSLYFSKDLALKQVEKMLREGADIIDVGGESTRPGAEPVTVDEEKKRVLPILEEIGRVFGKTCLSIDSQKFEVVAEAVDRGVSIVNDVSGGRHPCLAPLVKKRRLKVILMHMQNEPKTMQLSPSYPSGVIREVEQFLKNQVSKFEKEGVPRDDIWIDPGIGFGKKADENLMILKSLQTFKRISETVVIGSSRKSFISHVLKSGSSPGDRLGGTIASNLFAMVQGASVFRVHDVLEIKQALEVWEKICESQEA